MEKLSDHGVGSDVCDGIGIWIYGVPCAGDKYRIGLCAGRAFDRMVGKLLPLGDHGGISRHGCF